MAEAASTAWYRLGTVSVTDGSRKVTGNGTRFLSAGINPGAAFRIDKRPYAWEIKNVVSDTELELAAPYYGGTVSNASYSIDRNHQSTLAADISARLALALGNWEARYDLDMQTITGKSAYEVAVEEGFKGTKAQWLESLKGAGEYPEIVIKVEPLTYHSASSHNSIYRGKNLGTTITAEQSAAIRNGTFKDIYPGDYWHTQTPAFTWTDKDGAEHEFPANTGPITYYVAGCNCLRMIVKNNDYPIIGNHVVVCMYSHRQERMNDTASTEGGYADSEMATNTLRKYAALFKAVFGEEHIMKHGDWLCNAVTDGVESGYSWYEDREADLLSEEMVFGRRIQNKSIAFPGISQFPLFAFNHELLRVGGMHSWLRDAVSSTSYACMRNVGGSANLVANHPTYGVCNPFFLLY